MVIVFDTVLKIVGVGILLAAGVILYLIAVTRTIPRRVLRPVYSAKMSDRGLRRCLLPEGRAVVYEPGCRRAPSIRQYVIIVSSGTGHKMMKCLTDGQTDQIGYDVAVFDTDDRLTDILRVDEYLNRASWTQAVILPPETNYVSVIQRTRDGARISDEPIFASAAAGRVAAVALTVVLTAALAALMRLSLSEIFGAVHLAGQVMPVSWGVTCLTGALIGALLGGCMLLRDRKLIRTVINI
ncbi:MAG: hypothetical protein MJ192_01480 [Clostridia bacterium]|nr:hypothetical protein [Clostridia bacterium]